MLLIVQNTDSTRFDLLWFEFASPLWLMLLAAMLSGVLIGLARRRGRHQR